MPPICVHYQTLSRLMSQGHGDRNTEGPTKSLSTILASLWGKLVGFMCCSQVKQGCLNRTGTFFPMQYIADKQLKALLGIEGLQRISSPYKLQQKKPKKQLPDLYLKERCRIFCNIISNLCVSSFRFVNFDSV